MMCYYWNFGLTEEHLDLLSNPKENPIIRKSASDVAKLKKLKISKELHDAWFERRLRRLWNSEIKASKRIKRRYMSIQDEEDELKERLLRMRLPLHVKVVPTITIILMIIVIYLIYESHDVIANNRNHNSNTNTNNMDSCSNEYQSIMDINRLKSCDPSQAQSVDLQNQLIFNNKLHNNVDNEMEMRLKHINWMHDNGSLPLCDFINNNKNKNNNKLMIERNKNTSTTTTTTVHNPIPPPLNPRQISIVYIFNTNMVHLKLNSPFAVHLDTLQNQMPEAATLMIGYQTLECSQLQVFCKILDTILDTNAMLPGWKVVCAAISNQTKDNFCY